jgi:hypothetical protein
MDLGVRARTPDKETMELQSEWARLASTTIGA